MKIGRCTFKISALVSNKNIFASNVLVNADIKTYIYQVLSDKTWQYICAWLV